MSKVKTAEEARVYKEKLESFKGRPDRKAYSVKSEEPEGEKAPHNKGEEHMGGVRKSGDEEGHMGHHAMSHARAHLERETERGHHAAEIGGEKMHEHSGRHGHKE